MFGSLGPVDNTTLRERVYRTLKQAILEGRFSPGDTIAVDAEGGHLEFRKQG